MTLRNTLLYGTLLGLASIAATAAGTAGMAAEHIPDRVAHVGSTVYYIPPPAAITYPRLRAGDVEGTFVPVDRTTGMWGTQAIEPARDLRLAREGNLIGDRVVDPNGVPVGRIDYLLVDANSLHGHYVVVGLDRTPTEYVVVPVSVLQRSSDSTVRVYTPATQISELPHYVFVQ